MVWGSQNIRYPHYKTLIIKKYFIALLGGRGRIGEIKGLKQKKAKDIISFK